MIPLNQISVAKPCHESWDAMTGDDKKRFCGGCKKNVYNLSAMTEAEVQETLNVGSPCVRFYRRVDGTVLTQDCPVGVKRVRLRMAAAVSGAAAAIFSAVAGRQVLADATMAAPPITNGAIIGDVAYVPPAVTGQPAAGKPVPPKKPHAKPPKNHKKPLPETHEVTMGRYAPPPPHVQPTMGIVAWPQHLPTPKVDPPSKP